MRIFRFISREKTRFPSNVTKIVFFGISPPPWVMTPSSKSAWSIAMAWKRPWTIGLIFVSQSTASDPTKHLHTLRLSSSRSRISFGDWWRSIAKRRTSPPFLSASGEYCGEKNVWLFNAVIYRSGVIVGTILQSFPFRWGDNRAKARESDPFRCMTACPLTRKKEQRFKPPLCNYVRPAAIFNCESPLFCSCQMMRLAG